MSGRDPRLDELHEGRERFLALIASTRPELHRYCARMVGSVTDGEDIVQDTLARAYYALSQMEELPPLRPWLFRIAHNRALDHLRRYERRMGEPLDAVADAEAVDADDPGDVLAHAEAIDGAISRFLELAPAQRSCVILKDVLEHSLEEIAVLLEMSVPAVKAALHRGRTRLIERRAADAAPAAMPREPSPALARYAALFNARDWDGVRAMLAEDVRLDLVSRSQRVGRRLVGGYLANYDRLHDWHLLPAWLDGREVIAAFRNPDDARPSYFIELTLVDGKVSAIRDFRYAAYVASEVAIRIG